MDLLLSVAARALVPTAVAGAALSVGRVKSAAARHAVWTVVTMGMLFSLILAPVLPPLALRVLPAGAPAVAHGMILTDTGVALPAPTSPTPNLWEQGAMIVYALGVAICLIRLAFGYALTRRLLRGTWLVECEIYESRRISVPLTVGWVRPKILLPACWREWDAARLEAVLAHERAHVRRGDWAIAGMAAFNSCVFWFHPLAWWLDRTLATLAEQACDDAAVLETGSRTQYAQVLLDMAAAVKSNRGRLVWESMAMAKASEVRVRIDRILDETRPITPGLRRPWHAALLVCGLPLMWAMAVLQVVPAIGQEQTQTPGKPASAAEARSSGPVEPAPAPKPAGSTPAPARTPASAAKPAPVPASAAEPQTQPAPLTLLKRVEPEYPRVARQVGAKGTVEMAVTVLPDGHVSAVKVLRGHPLLQSAAIEAVKQWVYSAQPEETTTLVNLSFAGDETSQHGVGLIQQAVLIFRKAPVYPAEARRAGITGVVTLNITIGKDGSVGNVRTVRGEPVLAVAAEEAVRQWIYKPSMLNGAPVETESQVILNFTGGSMVNQPPASMDGNSFEKAELISRKEPVHPGGEFRHVAGTVAFRATVGVDGRLSNIRATDGPAELVAAALDAVKQWVYRPAKLGGKPVEADTQIFVQFAAER